MNLQFRNGKNSSKAVINDLKIMIGRWRLRFCDPWIFMTRSDSHKNTFYVICVNLLTENDKNPHHCSFKNFRKKKTLSWYHNPCIHQICPIAIFHLLNNENHYTHAHARTVEDIKQKSLSKGQGYTKKCNWKMFYRLKRMMA